MVTGSGALAKPKIDPVRLVHYSAADTADGWYWEVHSETRRVYYVNDDAALTAKYQVKAPKATDADIDAAESRANEDAIAVVKATPNLYWLTAKAKPESKWGAGAVHPLLDQNPYMNLIAARSLRLPLKTDPVRLVIYGDSNGFGFYWEVHLDSKRAYFANDDAELSAKYLK